jgi:hypothetical protein
LWEANKAIYSSGTSALSKYILPARPAETSTDHLDEPTRTLIHTFAAPSTSSSPGIAVLTQSPAVDVLGIGYQDGTIRIMDIRQGEDIFKFKMEEGGIAGLSFRMGESWWQTIHRSFAPADLVIPNSHQRDRPSWRAPLPTELSPSGTCTSVAKYCTQFATHTRQRSPVCSGSPVSRS